MSLPAIELDLPCPDCGYNLRGLTGECCPECGGSLEFLRGGESLLPWLRRKQIGRIRAFWATVWLMMWRRKRFAAEIARPADFASAQRFRLIVVILAYVPLWCVVTHYVDYVATQDELSLPRELTSWTWPVLVFLGSIFLALLAVTGLPSYFFHPRALSAELQNRAIALSYYLCAPLAWLPLVAALIWLSLRIDRRSYLFLTNTALLAFAATVGVGLWLLASWWLAPPLLMRLLMPGLKWRAWCALFMLPILGCLLLASIGVGLPAFILYFAVILRNVL